MTTLEQHIFLLQHKLVSQIFIDIHQMMNQMHLDINLEIENLLLKVSLLRLHNVANEVRENNDLDIEWIIHDDNFNFVDEFEDPDSDEFEHPDSD